MDNVADVTRTDDHPISQCRSTVSMKTIKLLERLRPITKPLTKPIQIQPITNKVGKRHHGRRHQQSSYSHFNECNLMFHRPSTAPWWAEKIAWNGHRQSPPHPVFILLYLSILFFVAWRSGTSAEKVREICAPSVLSVVGSGRLFFLPAEIRARRSRFPSAHRISARHENCFSAPW